MMTGSKLSCLFQSMQTHTRQQGHFLILVSALFITIPSHVVLATGWSAGPKGGQS